MNILRVLSVTTVLVLSTSANADLVGRLAATPGGTDYQAYYNDEANLTWLADANYVRTAGGYGNPNGAGRLDWATAKVWAADLIVDGVDGWRLPYIADTGSPGCDFSYTGGTDCGFNVDTSTSELANLFFNVLGGVSSYDTNGNVRTLSGLGDISPFSNVQSYSYWSDTEYYVPNYAWVFNMDNGAQAQSYTIYGGYAWAVQTGDVSAVPVPAAVWLFGSGLLGLIAVARRKKV